MGFSARIGVQGISLHDFDLLHLSIMSGPDDGDGLIQSDSAGAADTASSTVSYMKESFMMKGRGDLGSEIEVHG